MTAAQPPLRPTAAEVAAVLERGHHRVSPGRPVSGARPRSRSLRVPALGICAVAAALLLTGSVIAGVVPARPAEPRLADPPQSAWVDGTPVAFGDRRLTID